MTETIEAQIAKARSMEAPRSSLAVWELMRLRLEVEADIACHPFVLSTCGSGAIEEACIGLFGEGGELLSSQMQELWGCREVASGAGYVIEGADILTGVTAIEPRTYLLSQLLGDLTSVLDGEVIDAAPGV